jgi:hypothetical protein
MSDQRNNFVQDEVYENLEVRAVTVQIAVCCDLTPRGLLDSTYKYLVRTGTPAAPIVIYAEEKVPDFSETLICMFKAFCQKRHSLLKHKMLQLTLKISLYMAPTCFGPFGPSSESIGRNLAKVTIFVELLVKIHR